MTRINVVCVVEPDGFHAHHYQIYRGPYYNVTIIVHLHAWMAEHQAAWPDRKPVEVWRGETCLGRHDNLEEAWADERPDQIPAVDCQKEMEEPA